MKWYDPYGRLLMVIAIIAAAAIFAGCVEDENPVPTPTTTPSPDPTQAATLEAPTATPTLKPESTVGWTYNNPAQLGDMVLSTSKAFQLAAIKIERGPQVNAAVTEANMFNDPPHAGNEYMFVQIRFEYLEGDREYPLWRDDFKVYVNDVALESPHVVLPDDHPAIFQTDLMPGGKVERWLCFEVPVGEDVILAYDREMNYPVYYFEVA